MNSTKNGKPTGPVTDFEWSLTENGDNLFMEFEDQTSFSQPCSGSMEFPVKVNNKNKVTLGESAFGFGIEVELTK